MPVGYGFNCFAPLAITTDDLHTQHLLRPVFVSCSTKNATFISIALSSLQHLNALRAVFLSALPAITQTMNDCMSQSQGADIQLMIIQTLLSLIADFPAIHDRLLADVRVFVLCFLFSSLTSG